MGKKKKKKRWRNKNNYNIYYNNYDIPDVAVSSEQIKNLALIVFGSLYYETTVSSNDK